MIPCWDPPFPRTCRRSVYGIAHAIGLSKDIAIIRFLDIVRPPCIGSPQSFLFGFSLARCAIPYCSIIHSNVLWIFPCKFNSTLLRVIVQSIHELPLHLLPAKAANKVIQMLFVLTTKVSKLTSVGFFRYSKCESHWDSGKFESLN